jgi:hypothetical protein
MRCFTDDSVSMARARPSVDERTRPRLGTRAIRPARPGRYPRPAVGHADDVSSLYASFRASSAQARRGQASRERRWSGRVRLLRAARAHAPSRRPVRTLPGCLWPCRPLLGSVSHRLARVAAGLPGADRRHTRAYEPPARACVTWSASARARSPSSLGQDIFASSPATDSGHTCLCALARSLRSRSITVPACPRPCVRRFGFVEFEYAADAADAHYDLFVPSSSPLHRSKLAC